MLEAPGVSIDTVKVAVRPLEERLAELEAAEEEAARQDGSSDGSSRTSSSGSSSSASSSSSSPRSSASTSSSDADDDGGSVVFFFSFFGVMHCPTTTHASPGTPEPASGSANLPNNAGVPGLKPLDLRAASSSPPLSESSLPPPKTPKTPSVIPGLSLTAKVLSGGGSPTTDSPSPVSSPWLGTSRSTLRSSESGSFLKRGSHMSTGRPTDSLLETDLRDAPPSTLKQTSKETAQQRLTALAIKLGETFMASDLTALLQLKKQAAPPTRDKGMQARVELDEQKPVNRHILDFRRTKGYTIKMVILNVLALVSVEASSQDYFDPPINLMLSELCASRKVEGFLLFIALETCD